MGEVAADLGVEGRRHMQEAGEAVGTVSHVVISRQWRSVCRRDPVHRGGRSVNDVGPIDASRLRLVGADAAKF